MSHTADEPRPRALVPDGGEGSRPTAGISYLDGPRLRRTLMAATVHVARQRRELDRINVFPVPDGDTGTNLVLTLRSVADALEPVRSRSVAEVAAVAAEAGVLGARGNSGMLFSQFLSGFAASLRERLRAGTAEMADALWEAAVAVHAALEQPREGTIVTVAREVAAEARRRAHITDLGAWLRALLATANESLQRTRDLLPALREAGVVDAGAKGFVAVLEGALAYIEGSALPDLAQAGESEVGAEESVLAHARAAGVGAAEGRWCTQIAIRGAGLPDESAIRARLEGLGTSTIVLRTGAVAKIHIHADQPDRVRSLLAELGSVVTERVEDTRAGVAARRVAVVTDSSADLPQEWVEREGVTIVPLYVMVGDRTWRDGIDLRAERLLELLRTPEGPLPTTSQPAPRDFAERYRRALEAGAEEILAIYLSSAVSGTFNTGLGALRELDGVRWEAVDSRSGSLGTGLLVARAVELLDAGHSLEETAARLRRIRDRSNVFFTVDDLECLLRSGRIGRARAWLGGLLELKPILSVDAEGRIASSGVARGREALVERVLQLVEEELGDAERYRFGVVDFGAPDMAARVRRELERRFDPIEILQGPVHSAALAVHVGPGAWAVACQVEDEREGEH